MSSRFLSIRLLWVAVLTFALTYLPQSAMACTVCMGKPTDSPIADAMNGAIYFMLACIGGMLAFLSFLGYLLVRRAHTPLPPHLAFTEPTTSSSETL